jgi:hypothetical protein
MSSIPTYVNAYSTSLACYHEFNPFPPELKRRAAGGDVEERRHHTAAGVLSGNASLACRYPKTSLTARTARYRDLWRI